MTLSVADRWFERERVDDGITRLWEPHVIRLEQCNIWHVRGRSRDMLIDTGMGVASLKEAARDIFDRPLVAVATHTHVDHVGSLQEFGERIVHRAEADRLERSEPFSLLRGDHPIELIRSFEGAGYGDLIIDFSMLDALDSAYELATPYLDEFIRSGRGGGADWDFLWLPEMRPFRQDTRFQAYVTRMNLIPYWLQDGPPDDCDVIGGALKCH
jgi:Metallo-beta-lactamase superfamily